MDSLVRIFKYALNEYKYLLQLQIVDEVRFAIRRLRLDYNTAEPAIGQGRWENSSWLLRIL